MRENIGGLTLAAALTAGLSLAAPAVAQTTPDNKDALKCQTNQAKNSEKFVGSKAKCAMKCLVAARKTSGPYTACQPPGFTDPATNTCISNAQAKASAAIAKGCANDCPDCYADDSPSNCPDGDGFIQNANNQVNAFGPLVFCLEAAGNTPTKEQAKCEDGVAKALVKYVAAFGKAVAKCVTNDFNAKIPDGACAFSGTTVPDPATQTALDTAQTKAIAAIDKVCASAGANPACYGTAFDTGQEWTNLVESVLAGAQGNSYCGM
jgi:hypothetical protein